MLRDFVCHFCKKSILHVGLKHIAGWGNVCEACFYKQECYLNVPFKYWTNAPEFEISQERIAQHLLSLINNSLQRNTKEEEINLISDLEIKSGTISASKIDPNVLPLLRNKGKNKYELHFRDILAEIRNILDSKIKDGSFTKQIEETLCEIFQEKIEYNSEKLYYFTVEKVKGIYNTGRDSVTILESPFCAKVRLWSPRHPEMGNLENPDPDKGYVTYSPPDYWYRDWKNAEENNGIFVREKEKWFKK